MIRTLVKTLSCCALSALLITLPSATHAFWHFSHKTWSTNSKGNCYFNSNSLQHIKGSKKLATKKIIQNDAIGVLSICCIIKCTIQLGSENSLIIQANENIIDKVVSDSKDKKLTLTLEPGNYKNIKVHCILTLKQLPKEIQASGTSEIMSNNNNIQDTLVITASGNSIITLSNSIFNQVRANISGDAQLDMSTTHIIDANIEASGNSQILFGQVGDGFLKTTLHGKSHFSINRGSLASFKAKLHGNSSIEASLVNTRNANLSTSGNATIELGKVFTNFTATASGNSSIFYETVKPINKNMKISIKKSGRGTITTW